MALSFILGGCTNNAVSDQSEADTSENASLSNEIKKFDSEELGISFAYDSKWIVDADPTEPKILLKYGAHSEITIELLWENLDLNEFTQPVMDSVFRDYFMPDEYSRVNETHGYQYVRDEEKSYVGISGEYAYLAITGNDSNMTKTITKKETWYLVSVNDEEVYFIRYVEEGDTDYSSVAEALAKSVSYFGPPSLKDKAISFEKYMPWLYEDENPQL